MIFRRMYYQVKPFVPWSLRMALRRLHARRVRRRCVDVWPIYEPAGRAPEGWPGWPDGKKFALVLTHDVEGQKGLDRVRPLMELEMRLGFRSSFNFVPEGDYRTPKELRDLLTANGFEVGVHDLRHDGKLYRSRREFQANAEKINRYVKEWNAVGFRSGLMHHNLEWLHDLDVLYDASTFDTDPFEPQPDGMHTIFPFWVPQRGELNGLNKGGRGKAEGAQGKKAGYVELPYTLPQDSTLFLLFRERNNDVWKQKLDWIASKGGMVLLNTHPDYMSLSGPAAADEFPIGVYEEFLTHLKTQYNGSFWHGLPTDVTVYVQPQGGKGRDRILFAGIPSDTNEVSDPIRVSGNAVFAPTMKESAGKVLMFVENPFPNDPRVKNECDVLKEAGYSVTVVALRKNGQPFSEMVDGIQVYRPPRLEFFSKVLSEKRTLAARIWVKVTSVVGYLSEYVYFTAACLLMSFFVAFRRGFDVIHAHNPPDTLFLVAAVHKLFGKKYIFDQHDLCPELYRSRYGAANGTVARVLQWVEWGNLKLADVTIATNESYKQIQIQRGGRDPDTIFVVRNGPNKSRMHTSTPSTRLRGMKKNILCYLGSLNPQDGVDYLLRAVAHLVYDLRREDFFCVIIGSGDSLEGLRKLSQALKLEEFVEFTGYISEQELKENLSAADICLDPDPSSPLNDVSTWIKIMEYMACAKPIVSFDLKESRYSAQNAALYVPPNDEFAFAQAIITLMDDPALRRAMGEYGRKRVETDLQWSIVSKNLLAAYQSLNDYAIKDAKQEHLRCAPETR